MAGSVSKYLEVKEDYQQAGGVSRMILLDMGYLNEIDKMGSHWVNLGSHDRSRAYAFTISFSLGCELCRVHGYL